MTNKTNYISLPQAKKSLGKQLSQVEKNIAEWELLKKEIVDNPITQSINPMKPALIDEFFTFFHKFNTEKGRLENVITLLEVVSDN